MDSQNKQNNIVGIFDSGVGGLSVWRELIKVIPGNRMIYVSDNAFSPYGPRPQSEIISRAMSITDFLIKMVPESSLLLAIQLQQRPLRS